MPGLLEQRDRQLPVDWVILGQQNTQSLAAGRPRRRARRLRMHHGRLIADDGFGDLGQPEMSAEMECAAAADFALDPDPATHQGHKVPAYRQAQPGATEPAAGGMMRLSERLEDPLLLLRRDAD